jgi:hypothetical protein
MLYSRACKLFENWLALVVAAMLMAAFWYRKMEKSEARNEH